MRRASFAFLVAMVLSASARASAQQRPLVTEDPEVVGEGRVLVEAGIEVGANVFYPVSGLGGDRLAVPVGISVGIGKTAELQIDSGFQILGIEHRVQAPLSGRVGPGDRTSDVIDLTVATKLRVVGEGRRRPALGVHLATTLPNASNESGLGLDTLNFAALLLAGKSFGAARIVGNAGVALLSDVLQGSLQHDALVAGLSILRPLTAGVDVVAEVAGRRVLFADRAPIGAEPRGEVRGALRYTRGRWRMDAGLVIGLTRPDPDIGVSLGATWIGQVR